MNDVKNDQHYTKYNYLSMRYLLDDFTEYRDKEFRGADEGRMEAITALVKVMHHYYRNRGYEVSKGITVMADYSPKMLPKRYDYGIVYKLHFTLQINGSPLGDVQDVKYEGETYSIKTKDVTLSFDVKTAFMEKWGLETYGDDDNREQTERDMAHDEEEMPQPEEQGLPPLREERHSRVSRVARL